MKNLILSLVLVSASASLANAGVPHMPMPGADGEPITTGVPGLPLPGNDGEPELTLPILNNVSMAILNGQPCPPNMACPAVMPSINISFEVAGCAEEDYVAEIDVVDGVKEITIVATTNNNLFCKGPAVPYNYTLQADVSYSVGDVYVLTNLIGATVYALQVMN